MVGAFLVGDLAQSARLVLVNYSIAPAA
jgi:hypothetical protein